MITCAFVGQRVFRNLVFHYAIGVPFYLSCGLSIVDVFLVDSVYWVSRALIDVPLGYLADSVGNKPALLAGTALTALAYLALSQASTFAWFAVTSVGLAVGHSLCIGTDSALTRAALERRAQAAGYPRTESLGWLGRNAALAVSMSLGGIVAGRLAYRTSIVLSAVFVVPALVCVLAIPASAADRAVRQHARRALRALRRHHADVTARLLVYAVFVVNEFTGNLLIQLVLGAHRVALERLALTFAAVLAVAAASSLLVPALSKLPPTRCLALMVGLVAMHFSLQFAGLSRGGRLGLALSLVGFLAYGVVRGIYHPIFRTWIGNNVEPAIRATVFAAASTTGTLAVGAANLAFAWVIERAGLAVLMAGCAAAVPVVVASIVVIAPRLARGWSIEGIDARREPSPGRHRERA